MMVQNPLLYSKLTPPRLPPRQTERPRVQEKLCGATAVPLTLISAPAGFGKTTATVIAVRALADANPATSLGWLSLDELDNDPLRFWQYFLAAVETAVPIDPSLAHSLTAPQPPPVLPLLATLLNRLADQPRPLLLVLDDLHQIEQGEIFAGLAFLLEHAPPNLHLLLVTRADPPLPLHRLRARGQLLEIRAADLRFDDEETAVFLKQLMPFALSDAEIHLLNRYTEGWAVGLQLTALALQGNPSGQKEFIARLAHNNRYILEYLTEEVLGQQPPEVQHFLLQTAVLQSLCAPLCDAVTQTQSGQAMLDYLEQRNLFLVPLGWQNIAQTAVPTYRYHHLFAALLQGRLRQTQPDMLPHLHHRAAVWYAAHDDVETAVEHALAAADNDLAARLLDEYASLFVLQGRARLVESWLHRLPPTAHHAVPRALVAFARALILRGRFAEVAPYLQQATAHQLAQTDLAFQAELHLLRATLADTQGDAQTAFTHAHLALQTIPPGDKMATALANFALAGALREQGEVTAAIAAYEQALPLCRAARLPLPEVLARAHLGFLYSLRGQLNRAALTARAGLADPVHHPVTASLHAVLSMVHLERNELAEAEQRLAEALALVRESGHNAAALHCHTMRCRLCLAHGDEAGARQAIEEAAALFARGAPAWLGPLLVEQQVMFWLAQHDPVTAAQFLDQAMTGIALAAPRHMGDLLQLARARILFWQRDEASLIEARALLDGLVATAVSQERQGIELVARLLRALVSAATGEAIAARTDLRHALALAQPEGYVRLFVEFGSPLAALLAAESHPYARQLLAAFPEAEQFEATAVSSLPEPLTERETAVLRLMATGLTYQQIAAELIVSVNTVRHHVKGLYSKLAVSSRAQAVARAQELGLL